MLSDADLRAELVRLGANPGPITASTRSAYQRKLQKLQEANRTTGRTASNGYGQSAQPASRSNGHGSADSLTDAQLRERLTRLGHNPGPITPATRGLYLKKLAKLQADTTDAVMADVNGYDRPAAASRSGARRRRPAPARDPEPEPEPEPEPMDEADRMDESDSLGFSLDESAAAAEAASYSPVEYEFGAATGGYRETGRSPMFDADPTPTQPQPTVNQRQYRPGGSSLFGDDPAPAPPTRNSVFRDFPAPAPPTRISIFGDDPAPAPAPAPFPPGRGSLLRDDPIPSVQSRYRPEPLSRIRHYPETLSPRSTGTRPASSLLPERRPTPPPADWRADRDPVTHAVPPPPARPSSLRQRVAAWVRPSPPPPPADYDTCSDSDPEEPEEPPPPPQTTLTPTQQLQAFRRRMAAGNSESHGQPGFQSAPAASPAHGASHLVPYCILLLAVVFFGGLVLSYLSLPRTDEAGGPAQIEAAEEDRPTTVFPICGDPLTDERGCVSRERLEPAVQLLTAVQPALVAAARDAFCGRRQLPSVPITELAQMTESTEEELRDLAVLVTYNSRLGLRAETEAGGETSLTAVGVSTPWLCLAGAALTFVIKWAFTLTAVSVGLLTVRGLVLWRRRSLQKQQQQLYQMVESIMEVVRRHTLTATAADKPYVAIDHVRDELLTPKERSSRDKMALWQRAVQFIRDRESRVREECVMVAGESHTVWRWLPGTAGGGRERRRVWLGQAFQTSSGVNTPVHTRTNCLKIRHMFDPTCETSGSGWQQDVRDALLEKCDGISVLHVAVDDRSTEGLVYVKCRTDADALSAFKRIQGCWFDGRLVSVKFIRLERFHERYPDAASVTEPLRPSNGLRRSLADLPTPVATEDD